MDDDGLGGMPAVSYKTELVGTGPSLAVLLIDDRAPVLSKRPPARQTEERNLTQEHVGHVRENPLLFASQLGAWASGTGWRSYSNYIGQPIGYPTFSAEMKQALLSSSAVQQRIHSLADSRLAELSPSATEHNKIRGQLERQLTDVAAGIAGELVARMDSTRFIRFFGALINQILVRMYDQGLNVSVEEWTRFRTCAQDAATNKQSMIFLPCHKSHIDYLTISFLAFRLGIALPHIIAGENLAMPVVGPALQKCGAVWIRRSFGDDALYGTMVQEYIEQLLEKGHNFEVFVEGTRSRTGKLLPPKYGILKYIVDAVLNDRTQDVWMCPISLQYDRIIETATYVNELLGTPKEKESLAGLISGSSVLNLKLGRVDVRFEKPFSLRAFIEEQRQRRLATSQADFSTNREHKALLLRAIGYRVLSDINSVAVIMPAALVATILLTLRGRGVGRGELIRRVDWLRGAIIARGGRVASFHDMSTAEVVDRALLAMKDLIGEHTGLIEPTFYAVNRFQLSFFRNALLHIFIQEAILCATLYTKVKQGGGALNQRMLLSDVMRELSWLSQLLASEFVYRTEGLESNASATIGDLEREKVLKSEGGFLGLADEERQSGRERYDFSCFLLWPFIESYWCGAVALFALTPPAHEGVVPVSIFWFNEKDFLKRAQLLAKTLFYQGDVSYLEAVNQATLLNAFERYQGLGMMLRRHDRASKGPPLVALAPEWVPERREGQGILPEGKLWAFLERLGSFRREGKNRRDIGTLPARIFSLVNSVIAEAFEREPLESAHL